MDVSHSKVKVIRRCLKAYDYKYIQRISKRVKSRQLLIGGLVHECIENYFKNGSYIGVINGWKEEVLGTMFKDDMSLNSDIVPLVKGIMRGYVNNWRSHGLEVIWVEKEFNVYLKTVELNGVKHDINLKGKIDMLAKDTRKRTWLTEHKTHAKMPGEEARVYDTQLPLYYSILPKIGEDIPTGIMWDYLRTKPPAKPQLLKNGELSKSVKVDTTEIIFLRQIKKHGLNVEDYEEVLKSLRGKEETFYRKIFLPMSPQFAEGILGDVLASSYMMIIVESKPELISRNINRDCSWCDYNLLCNAELRGEDTEFLMKHDYYRRSDEKTKK